MIERSSTGTFDKAFPVSSGDTVSSSKQGEPLSSFWTPIFVLARDRIEHNARWMSEWCASKDVELMPHGKTTMAPKLWKLQLAHGATGITVATPWQLRVALESGITSVQLANQMVDPEALRWVQQQIAEAEDRGQRIDVWAWADDVRAVRRMDETLDSQSSAKLNLLVDLGRPGHRTGARSVETAVEVAEAIAAAQNLRLSGIAGYEGAIVSGRTDASIVEIENFLDDMISLHERISNMYESEEILVSAGGSAFPEVVARGFSRIPRYVGAKRLRVVLRSGAYLIHDDGFYQQISPFSEDGLLAAGKGISRVVSQPEEGLALLDGGKRDFPYDEGMPRPLYAYVKGESSPIELESAEIRQMNDQHSFLYGDVVAKLSPGDIVVLGLSHPCTMFDKWRRIPVVECFDGNFGIPDMEAPVIDTVETTF